MIGKIIFGIVVVWVGFWLLMALWPFLMLILGGFCAFLCVGFIYSIINGDDTRELEKFKKKMKEKHGK